MYLIQRFEQVVTVLTATAADGKIVLTGVTA